MKDFLIDILRSTWPYYILAFVVAEALLFVKEKRGLFPEIIFALFICILLTILTQYQSHSASAAEHRPILLSLVNFLSILTPLTVLVLANQLIPKMRNAVQKHFALLIVVTATMFIWPLWALYLTCASGLDCL